VPADKAANNVIIVCKTFYLDCIVKELTQNENATYIQLPPTTTATTIVEDLATKMSNLFGMNTPTEFRHLASAYWTAKMHKNPPSQRFIAASNRCVLKEVSRALTRILKALTYPLKGMSMAFRRKTGVSPWWIIDNSKPVLQCIDVLNRRGISKTVHSFDFKTLYTKIPHDSIKKELHWVVKQAFTYSKTKDTPFLKMTSKTAGFRKTKKGKGKLLNEQMVCKMVDFLVDNLYTEVGDRVFRQCVGIPMGTDCAPYLANLYLFALEYKYLDKLYKTGATTTLQRFRYCFRYIDDLLTMNNTIAASFDFSQVYPPRTDSRTN
jgi:hypothetical protein